MREEQKSFEFYKKFYEDNKVALLQYKSLRTNFESLVNSVLGKDYYNMGMDVYECDRICCKDIEYITKQKWILKEDVKLLIMNFISWIGLSTLALFSSDIGITVVCIILGIAVTMYGMGKKT